MQKPMWFSMGLMAGVIAVLLTIVVMQNREPMAYAQAAGGGDADTMMYSGGAQSQIQDIIWVLHKKNTPKKPGADPDDIIANKTMHHILACYQVVNQGRGVRLVGIRDISFDLDIPEYKNEKPTVREIITELKKAQGSSSRKR